MSFKVRVKDEREFEELIRELSSAELKESLSGATTDAIKEVGQRLHQKIVSNIQNGRPDWPALSRVTQELKGGAQPLIDSGTMLRAIQVQFVGEVAIVGIPEGSQYPDGTPVDIVAAVMEEGAVIQVSDRMRNFMAAQGFPLRKETQVVVIPARPFFEPAVTEIERELPEILEEVSRKVVA